MSLAVAWGTSPTGLSLPDDLPYVAGNGGSIGTAAGGNMYFGLTEAPGGSVAIVMHTFTPAGGAKTYQGTYCLDAASADSSVYVWDLGDHVLTFAIDGVMQELSLYANISAAGAEWGEFVPPEGPAQSPDIAWGASSWGGGYPEAAPFTPGTEGSVAYGRITLDRFTFGLVGGIGAGVVSVAHTYAPADGGLRYLVETIYLPGDDGAQKSWYVEAGQNDGIHKFVASSGGVQASATLILAVAPDEDPANNGYGAASWYEEAVVPSTFWTLFVNAEERP